MLLLPLGGASDDDDDGDADLNETVDEEDAVLDPDAVDFAPTDFVAAADADAGGAGPPMNTLPIIFIVGDAFETEEKSS
uniref:Uncharacterized protein n=1 Tax=Romanomermis culicivorax TaxID=13658 RepID=A0A915HU00_ROMCU